LAEEVPMPTTGNVLGRIVYLIHLLNGVPDPQSRRKRCLPMPARSESKLFRSVGSIIRFCNATAVAPDKLSVYIGRIEFLDR
jgi:hypothetical protein